MEKDMQEYDIGGMDCADCARKISEGVQKLPGVTLSDLNFMSSKLTVQGSAERAAVIERVEALGYQVKIEQNHR